MAAKSSPRKEIVRLIWPGQHGLPLLYRVVNIVGLMHCLFTAYELIVWNGLCHNLLHPGSCFVAPNTTLSP